MCSCYDRNTENSWSAYFAEVICINDNFQNLTNYVESEKQCNSCFAINLSGRGRQCQPPKPANNIFLFIIYQSSKFSFSCVSLMESVSREIDEIRLSPSHQRAREIIHYSQNNKTITCPSREHAAFGQPKTANVL